MNGIANGSAKWYCPKCGVIPQEKIEICNKSLKKQQISVLPILPTCKFCYYEIVFNKSQLSGKPHKIIALTGTCVSGKTSTAEILMSKYGFYGIDGDSVMNVIKYKSGVTKVDFNEIFNEIINHIDILLLLQKNIVISTVIIPEYIPKYREFFESRSLIYKFFLLQPSYSSALSRSKTRTCFNGITPEEWVKHFYDELRVLEHQDNADVVIFDNSEYTVEESAEAILNILMRVEVMGRYRKREMTFG